ncbi:MAG: hypothetical protein R2716_08155 [Microthrixaceae bacterium]
MGDAPLELEVSPRRQEVAPGAAASFDISVANTGTQEVRGVQLSAGADFGGPQFADCSRDLGILPAGGRIEFSCSGTDYTAFLPTTFLASGTVDGLAYPLRSAVEVAVYEADDTRPPLEFDVDLTPAYQQVGPGQQAVLTARVGLPSEITDSRLPNGTIEAYFSGLENCDTQGYVPGQAATTGQVELACVATEGVDFTGDLETYATVLIRTNTDFTTQHTYIVQSPAVEIAVEEPEIQVEVTADPASVAVGGSTELDVTITNPTTFPFAGAETDLLELSPGYAGSTTAVAKSECREPIPDLAPGESTSLSCTVPVGPGAIGTRQYVVRVGGVLELEGPAITAPASSSGTASVEVTPADDDVTISVEGPWTPLSQASRSSWP